MSRGEATTFDANPTVVTFGSSSPGGTAIVRTNLADRLWQIRERF